MATGTLLTLHNAVTTGFSVEVTATSTTAFDEICHTLGTAVRANINSEELTLVYVNVNSIAPFYGFVLRVSSQVVVGILYYTNISSSTFIKFRDSSSDAAATYKAYNANSV